jgi:deoxyribonuclease V
MKSLKIACFDVYYYREHACACCLVFEIEPYERVLSRYSVEVKPIALYIPGKFYRRELPCILKVYGRVKEEIDLLLVDGYVFLENDRKGLGGHLFEALRGKTPVIGVAKSFYRGCRNYREVYRGKSGRPLFVSSIGVPLPYAAELIKNLKGKGRLPDLLREVDRLSRS